MQCPNCRADLNTIEVIDNFGQEFEIEQCPSCGGFWFDRNELYRVPVKVALQLDPPAPIKSYSGNLQCPHDKTLLVEFKDPNLPPQLVIYRCPDCGGLFLSKGQLYAYKEYQREKTLKSIEFSRKSAIAISILFTLSLSILFGLFLSKNVLKADVVMPADTNLLVANFKDILLFLTIFTFLLMILVGWIEYLRKRK